VGTSTQVVRGASVFIIPDGVGTIQIQDSGRCAAYWLPKQGATDLFSLEIETGHKTQLASYSGDVSPPVWLVQ
jgi:hypothetical protein